MLRFLNCSSTLGLRSFHYSTVNSIKKMAQQGACPTEPTSAETGKITNYFKKEEMAAESIAVESEKAKDLEAPKAIAAEAQPSEPEKVKQTGFKLQEKSGDLFSCPKTDSLAHCISADVKMGAGIAVQFRKRFGNVPTIQRQNKSPGEVAVLEKDGKYVYNLITKVKYNHKPTYNTLRGSLEAMKVHAKQHRVKAISMPRIGSGLDKLDWSQVKNIITELFEDTDLRITVYVFDPRKK